MRLRPVIGLLASLLFIVVHAGVEEDIARYTKKVSDLAKATIDVYVLMDHVVKGSRDMLRFGGAAGVLLATALDVAYKPKTPEFNALVRLQEDMKRNFAEIEDQMESIQKLTIDFFVDGIMSKVSLRLGALQDIYSTVTNATDGHMWKEEYIASCRDVVEGVSPLSVMKILHLNFYTNCKITDRFDQIWELQETLLKLTRLATRETIQSYEAENLEAIESVLISKMMSLSSDQSRKDFIERLSNLKPNTVTALHEQLKEINEDVQDGRRDNTCLLPLMYKTQRALRSNIEEEIAGVMNMLTDLTVLTQSCAYVLYPENPKKIERYENIAHNLLLETTTFMQKWLTKTLEDAWPREGQLAAKKILGSSDLSSYDGYATRVRRAFEERGPKKFNHQVVVTKYHYRIDWWDVLTVNNGSYASVLGHSDVDVHVFRYPHGSIGRAKEGSEKFGGLKSKIYGYLESHALWDTTNGMLEAINLGTDLIHEKRYHSALIIRGRAWRPADASIKIKIAVLALGGYDCWQNVDFFVNPVIFDARALTVYFFL